MRLALYVEGTGSGCDLMQDSLSFKLIVSGGFALAAVLWLVRNRKAVLQLWATLSEPVAGFLKLHGAYRIVAIAVAASWLLIPISLWAPNSQVWSSAGGLLVSFSMLVQFRAEGRRRLAKVSFWTTVISGVILIVTLLTVPLAHVGNAATMSVGSVGRFSDPRMIYAGPHDHSDPPSVNRAP